MYNYKPTTEVMHSGLPCDGNSYWELKKEGKKRSLDTLDFDALGEMHDTVRNRLKYEDEVKKSIDDLHQGALEKHFTRLAKEQASVKVWYMYRLTQSVNTGYEKCYEALVVAPSKEEAKFISPDNMKPGWWAKDTFTTNVYAWESWELFEHDAKPMPLWYLDSYQSWVHPAFVEAELITSFDGDPKMHGRCISSSHTGC